MKLAIFSDVHFHNWPQFSALGPDGLNTRLRMTHDRVSEMLTKAEKHNCAAVLFGGDLFHVKRLEAEVIDTAVRAFSGSNIPIYGIPGNHDMATFGPDARHSARALSGRIQWLERTRMRIKHQGESVTIFGVPYQASVKALVDVLHPTAQTDLLLLHAGIAGMMMGSDYIADLGDCIDPRRLVGTARLVVAGHFHSPQVASLADQSRMAIEEQGGLVALPDHDGLLIPGSLEAHNFGDVGAMHGFWIVDLSNMRAEFVPSGSPEFMEISWHEPVWPTRSDRYYIKLRDVPQNIDPDVETAGLMIEREAPVINRPERAFHANVADAPDEVLRKYVEASQTTLDKGRLIKEGKRLLCN